MPLAKNEGIISRSGEKGKSYIELVFEKQREAARV
jgi:hypothetical protein